MTSLNSPSGSSGEDDHMGQYTPLSMNSPSEKSIADEDDLTMRAPYIPMGEDLPLLISTDLMWGPNGNEPKANGKNW